jgi:hypothetical protein
VVQADGINAAPFVLRPSIAVQELEFQPPTHYLGLTENNSFSAKFGNAQCSKWKYKSARITNSVAPEPEGSSPYSQEPATGPYPEPAGSNLHSPSQFP